MSRDDRREERDGEVGVTVARAGDSVDKAVGVLGALARRDSSGSGFSEYLRTSIEVR